jgi:hypothetical protein
MTNQTESELQIQIAELTRLLKPPYEAEDPVVTMGNALAALAAAITSQTEAIESLRADVANLTNAIMEHD